MLYYLEKKLGKKSYYNHNPRRSKDFLNELKDSIIREKKKTHKKNQMGILELKNTVTKISLDGLKSRMEMTEKKPLNLKIDQWKVSNMNNKE